MYTIIHHITRRPRPRRAPTPRRLFQGHVCGRRPPVPFLPPRTPQPPCGDVPRDRPRGLHPMESNVPTVGNCTVSCPAACALSPPAAAASCRGCPAWRFSLVGKIFKNIAIFPIFRHLAKMENKYRQFGYEMLT